MATTQALAAHDNVLGCWTLSLCCSFPTVLRWVTGKKHYWFHAPDPTKKEVDVTSAPPFNFTTFFSQLHALLLSWRREGFEFPSLTVSKCSPFISSVVSCSNLDTEKLSGVWDPLCICFTVLSFQIVSYMDPYFQTISGEGGEQLIAIAEHAWRSPGCFICAASFTSVMDKWE